MFTNFYAVACAKLLHCPMKIYLNLYRLYTWLCSFTSMYANVAGKGTHTGTCLHMYLYFPKISTNVIITYQFYYSRL